MHSSIVMNRTSLWIRKLQLLTNFSKRKRNFHNNFTSLLRFRLVSLQANIFPCLSSLNLTFVRSPRLSFYDYFDTVVSLILVKTHVNPVSQVIKATFRSCVSLFTIAVVQCELLLVLFQNCWMGWLDGQQQPVAN